MAVLRRRSARISQADKNQNTPGRNKTSATTQLGSLIERDETPDVTTSIDNVVETPASASTIKEQLTKITSIQTPKTEPRPERGQMHPKTIQVTTTKTPDSGLKLGFVDIPPHPRTLASLQNTPSKSRDSPQLNSAATFEFKFGSDIQLSEAAQKLMANVREEAAKIKAQMQVEKLAQEKKDGEADRMFSGTNAPGRKIAQPKGRSGRFSDVHKAQFRKMDSIQNHASSFRARPGFAQPTTQSLKRSGSKAGLDEVERPKTAGKESSGKVRPQFLGRPTSVSPFKSLPAVPSSRLENTASAKRQRVSAFEDASSGRERAEIVQPCAVSKPMSSTLFSPTKASLARNSQIPTLSPTKSTTLSRSNSVKSLRNAGCSPRRPTITANTFAPLTVESRAGDNSVNKPLPAIPIDQRDFKPTSASLETHQLSATSPKPIVKPSHSSKLPTFTGLKSILRSPHKPTETVAPQNIGQGTPKRLFTSIKTDSDKKVDFTPSVKSRYAVKLAAQSPSPAKMLRPTPYKHINEPVFPYDPAAYVIEGNDERSWEDAGSEIEYPVLPNSEAVENVNNGSLVDTFNKKAKDQNRRESKEFKSIFTTLHHPSRPSPSGTLTSVNTTVNRTGPTAHVNRIMRSPSNPNTSLLSPSTIRRVGSVGVTELVQPFEDVHVKTVPHGLPGKKRHHESIMDNEQHGTDEDAKENRRISHLPQVPGAWEDSDELDEDEGEKRAGKRARTYQSEGPTMTTFSSPAKEIKKPNAAREAAARNAKERKGILSLSKLNMLSRPKQRV